MSTLSAILASESYQRQRLLALLGVEFSARASHLEESAFHQEDFSSNEAYVSAIAAGKILAVVDTIAESERENIVVLGGDFLAFANGTAYGKPRSFAHARQMLADLADQEIQNVCAVGMWSQKSGVVMKTDVALLTLPALTEDERNQYLANSHILSAAGFHLAEYARQLRGRAPTASLEVDGSVSTILGFTAHLVAEELALVGIQTPVSPESLESDLRRDILGA